MSEFEKEILKLMCDSNCQANKIVNDSLDKDRTREIIRKLQECGYINGLKFSTGGRHDKVCVIFDGDAFITEKGISILNSND